MYEVLTENFKNPLEINNAPGNYLHPYSDICPAPCPVFEKKLVKGPFLLKKCKIHENKLNV